jgi:protein tyrosine/serine phosphatase
MKRILLASCLALSIAAAACAYLLRAPLPNHFRTVESGVLYRSAYPTPRELQTVIDRYGIKTVVNLCLPSDAANPCNCGHEQQVCAERGVTMVNLPIVSDQPPSDAVLKDWLEILASTERRPILVHCKHGVVRTGEMVAVYEMQFRQVPPARAWEELPRFGHDFESRKRAPVRAFILGYERRQT